MQPKTTQPDGLMSSPEQGRDPVNCAWHPHSAWPGLGSKNVSIFLAQAAPLHGWILSRPTTSVSGLRTAVESPLGKNIRNVRNPEFTTFSGLTAKWIEHNQVDSAQTSSPLRC